MTATKAQRYAPENDVQDAIRMPGTSQCGEVAVAESGKLTGADRDTPTGEAPDTHYYYG